MKLIRLELRAFGPFTEGVLDLETSATPWNLSGSPAQRRFGERTGGLHLVYGPNEAGKTSSLRALRQFFYGIPHVSHDDFRHNYQQLRIAGVLEHSDGRRLECVRRKGNKNSLRAADDNEPLDPDLLNEFLGGLSEELFVQMFGIDHEQLVNGGKDIVSGGGDVGEALFAGSGIADLHAIRKALEDEAENLFTPAARTRAINVALKELDELRKAVRQAQVPSSQWSQHDQAYRTACRKRDQLVQSLVEKQTQRLRLTRLLEALPAMAARKGLLEELKELESVPRLRKEFVAERVDAAANLTQAQSRAAQLHQALDSLSQQIAGIEVPQAILEQAEEIAALQQDLGSYRKAQHDRPRLEAELEQIRSDLAALLRRIRPDLPLDQAETLRLKESEQLRINRLATQQAALEAREREARKRLVEVQSQLEECGGRAKSMQRPVNSAPLKKLVHSIAKQGPLEKELAGRVKQLAQERRQIEIDLERLGLWSGTPPQLESLAVPLAETIDDFEERLRDARGRIDQLETRLAEAREHRRQAAAELESLEREHEIPNEARLLAARERREAGWELVRKRWRDGQPGDEVEQVYLSEFHTADLAAAYEASVDEADDVADRLRREAERVERHAALSAELTENNERCDRLDQDLAAAQFALAEIEGQWAALWQPLGIAPRTPREMRSWRQLQQALAKRIADCRSLEDEAAALQDRIESAKRDLLGALADMGEHAPSNASLEELVRCGEEGALRMEELNAAWKSLQEEQKRLEAALPKAQEELAQATAANMEWRDAWGACMLRLGLDASASADEATATLNLLNELFQKLHDAARLARQIEKIGRECASFAEHAAALAAQVAPKFEQASSDPCIITQELARSLDAARAAHQKRESLEQQHGELARELAAACETIDAMQARLAALCQEAGCEHPVELPAAEEQSARRRELEQLLRAKEEELLERSGGVPLLEFIAEAQRHQADQLAPQVAALSAEIEEIEREKADVQEEIGAEKTNLARLDGGSQGAEAAEQLQLQLAALGSHVERYARLRLASAVLQQAIERYREKNQDPILARAGEIFARLTAGSFEGLRVEIQDDGQGVLVGMRAGTRELVAVDRMSDGTADQLYLALRLASLERYLQHKEPVPFVVDDILIQFDNQRSVATLEALAELSQRTQVIFFTHHEHLLDLAREHLPEGTFCVHHLSPATTPQVA